MLDCWLERLPDWVVLGCELIDVEEPACPDCCDVEELPERDPVMLPDWLLALGDVVELVPVEPRLPDALPLAEPEPLREPEALLLLGEVDDDVPEVALSRLLELLEEGAVAEDEEVEDFSVPDALLDGEVVLPLEDAGVCVDCAWSANVAANNAAALDVINLTGNFMYNVIEVAAGPPAQCAL